MVEILTVIGIVALLAALLLPTLMRAQVQAQRTRQAADLQSISAALDAYKAEFGDYPRNPAANGATLLGQALIAPGNVAADGYDGPGFRVRAGGKVYQPYLPTDKFKMNVNEILDEWGSAILYFPASPSRPDVSQSPTAGNPAPYVDRDPGALYNVDQNYSQVSHPSDGPLTAARAIIRMRLMLGDTHDATDDFTKPDGVIQSNPPPPKSPEKGVNLPFLLWSAGPDGIYGPDAKDRPDKPVPVLDYHDLDKLDDVTNFLP